MIAAFNRSLHAETRLTQRASKLAGNDMFPLRQLIAPAVVFLMFASVAGAQRSKVHDNTREVQGVVSDDGGKAVPGAIVQLKNTKTLQIISFITKDNGDYYFHGLSADIDFELRAEKAARASATRTLSSFDTRKQAVINLKLDRDRK